MPLGREVGLGPGHTVLDKTYLHPSTSKRERKSPQFSTYVYYDETDTWIKTPLGKGKGKGRVLI